MAINREEKPCPYHGNLVQSGPVQRNGQGRAAKSLGFRSISSVRGADRCSVIHTTMAQVLRKVVGGRHEGLFNSRGTGGSNTLNTLSMPPPGDWLLAIMGNIRVRDCLEIGIQAEH